MSSTASSSRAPNDKQPVRHIRSRSEQMKDNASAFPICLVTGGAGYIGSHTVLELLTAGFAVVVVDNLCNSHVESLLRVHYIARNEFDRCGERERPIPPIFFHKVDIRDGLRLDEVFAFWQDGRSLDPERMPIDIAAAAAKKSYPMLEYTIDARKRTKINPLVSKPEIHGKIVCVIHFAALKAVGESLSMPLEYYEVNVAGLLLLLKAMKAHNVNTFVFSSSAVVYGKGNGEAITEDAVQIAGQGNGGGLLTNPYGRTKWMSEEIINDFCVANQNFHATSLRYFNPTGAHASGLIGENPKGNPNNIVPVILQTYERRRSKVQVFGSSYDTTDGTGVRDYIHVSDLAKGHLAALRKAVADQESPSALSGVSLDPEAQYHVYNLGTGRGYSVLEIIKAFSSAAGTEVPFALGDARPGDLGTVTASPEKAATELDWTAEFDLQDMCRDVFNWAAANPGGYEKLRRLSAMTGMAPKEMRRLSVASHLFESEDEFDSFVSGAVGTVASQSQSHSRPNSGTFSPLNTAGKRHSLNPLVGLLHRTARMSISSSSDDDDKMSTTFSTTSLESPTSPFFSPHKQPRWNMNWSDSFRSPVNEIQHTDLQGPINEEDEDS